MKSKLPIYLSLWGVSLGAAFFAGKSLSPAIETTETVQSAKSMRGGKSGGSGTFSDSGSVASMASAQARLDAAPMVKKGSTPEEMVADIARYDDAIERNNALLALIDSLAPEEFLSVVDAFRELGITQDRWGEYEMLLTAWAKVNPSEALDYASENTSGSFARNTILSTWASTNPDAAIAWAEANHENKDEANPWLVGVIEGIAPYDVARATGLMETMPRSRERGQALNTLIQQMMMESPEDAKAWAGTIQDEVLRSGAYATTAEAIARKNPAEAAEWLTELADVEALNRVGDDLAQTWYRESPEEATNWVTSLPAEAMGEAAEGIVDRVVREDPIQAAEWLSQLATANPDANFDGSIRELVRGSVRRDPELAATWVSGLSSNEDQTRYYHRILGEWNNNDSAAALNWVQANEQNLPESIARRFLNTQQQN
ncbi:hypothetical protein AAFN60_12615 [Roseibacillus persicicus]|uniref:hypothetical protein n=1 Tax=Roseibacillus persicicus TaxID=454148 RepID=UPI00398B880B